MITDERIDALLRRLDTSAAPDPHFVNASHIVLRDRARAARVRDASLFDRIASVFRVATSAQALPLTRRPVGVLVTALVLLLLALLAVAIAGAITRKPAANGSLIVSLRGELVAIDADGSSRPLLASADKALAVSRSPDDRLVTFWTVSGRRAILNVVGVDGTGERALGLDADVSAWKSGRIDTWSWDSTFLAGEIADAAGTSAVYVVDVKSGFAHAITPPSVIARNPLWSPDGKSIAFSHMPTASSSVGSLDVIGIDGLGMRTLTPRTGGPDTWSADGTWIYEGNDDAIYRVGVLTGKVEELGKGPPHRGVYAPTSSPDGTRIAFIRYNGQDFDLWGASSDGSNAHLLLKDATGDGWSPDGQSILADWKPNDQPGGLVAVTPETGAFRVVSAFDADCRKADDCLSGVGWGQARP